MSRSSRLLVVMLTLATLIGAFVALRPSDDDGASETSATQPAVTTPQPSGTVAPESAATPAPTPEPTPEPEVVEVKNLAPVGGVQKIRAKKDETVRFVVKSDRGENAHLHGYDIEKAVAPGRDARFTFKADITGIFELELENSAVPIAELRIDP